jgi:hypothetical protein
VDDTYLMWCEALRSVPGGMSQIKSLGLVLTEPPLNSNVNRETMVEVALEKLQCKAVSLQVQGIFSTWLRQPICSKKRADGQGNSGQVFKGSF